MAQLRRLTGILIVGFFLGISLNLSLVIDWSFVILLGFLILVFLILTRFYSSSCMWWWVIIILLGIQLGLTRVWLIPSEAQLSSLCPLTCKGVIVSDPDRRDKNTQLIVRLEETSAKILVLADNFEDYHYGDQISLKGELKKPKNFLTEQNKIFDYQNYLRARGIMGIIYYPKIERLAKDQGSLIKASLFRLKNRFLTNLNQVLPEPASSLAGGLILGDKGGLGKKIEADFRQAGVSHIIVLSGYNITIITESVLKFFAWLSAFWSGLLGLVAIFSFVLMVGGEASIMRAAIMGVIALLARHYGRIYEAGVALLLAGFLMVLVNPYLLVFDLGFQLSFLATLGLIYLSPLVEKILWRRPDFFKGLKELIITTTGAQIAVFPWLLWQTGNASLVGFISNVFILPIVPLAMLTSFLTGLTGFVSMGLAQFFSFFTYILLDYIILTAQFFAHLL